MTDTDTNTTTEDELITEVNFHNREVLFGALELVGIHKMEVEFKGYGAIQSVTAYDANNNEIRLPQTTVTIKKLIRFVSKASQVTTVLSNIDGAIQRVCVDYLDEAYDGSRGVVVRGTFAFNVNDKTITPNHHLVPWSDTCPNGRNIFYDGDDPEGFAKEMMDKYQFDVTLPTRADVDWGEEIAAEKLKVWEAKWGSKPFPSSYIKECGYRFFCPPNVYDEIWGSGKYRLSS